MELRHFPGAPEALHELGAALAAAGAEGELSFGILRTLEGEPHAWGEDVTILLGARAGRPVALVTVTGGFPALVVGFGEPEEVAFEELVGAMLGAGRRATAVNGARRWSEPFAAAWAAAGARPRVVRETRAFELRSLRRRDHPDGRFRAARADERDLLERWTRAMGDDIGEPVTPQDAARVVERLLARGDLVVWERDGAAVSMAAVNRRTPTSSSISLVYTPPELRRRGYASAVVAALSRRELEAGQRWCSLFTDLATSRRAGARGSR